MKHEEKIIEKLVAESPERSHLVTSEDFRRIERVIAETGNGTITFRSPMRFERIAVTESPYGLTLYADPDEVDLRCLLPGETIVMIEKPEEGIVYPAPEIEGAEAPGIHLLCNDTTVRAAFREVRETVIEAFVLQDRVVIDLYNVDAEKLTFRRIGNRIGAIADYDHTVPGDIEVRLDGPHTEIENEELAGLLMQYAATYPYDGDQGPCYGHICFQRDGETDAFLACGI